MLMSVPMLSTDMLMSSTMSEPPALEPGTALTRSDQAHAHMKAGGQTHRVQPPVWSSLRSRSFRSSCWETLGYYRRRLL